VNEASKNKTLNLYNEAQSFLEATEGYERKITYFSEIAQSNADEISRERPLR
jgi:hypothetical protein